MYAPGFSVDDVLLLAQHLIPEKDRARSLQVALYSDGRFGLQADIPGLLPGFPGCSPEEVWHQVILIRAHTSRRGRAYVDSPSPYILAALDQVSYLVPPEP